MHPDIRIELGRQKQAELFAAGEASRAAARVGGDERDVSALARPPHAGKDPSPVVAAATAPGGSAEIVKIHHRIRDLPARLRRALGSPGHRPYHPELEGPILIRYSGVGDQAALERLAALDSRKLPEGSFLLAEIDGELVAAGRSAAT